MQFDLHIVEGSCKRIDTAEPSTAWVKVNDSDHTYRQLTSLLIPPAGFNISTLSRLNFSARICNDVIVLLTKYQQERPQYEIVIGGWRNTQSAIRQRKEKTTLLTHQHSPLSCHEFRKFFISWKGAVLKVGSVREDASHPGGTVEEVFLQHTDPSPFPVRFAFVAGWSVAGVVKFCKWDSQVCVF
ncbi:C3 and PZP-like alpha-2-macroglobulin domain-containing protein 8 [Babylonia areolata]|uniref:C3 and PZP-like alpha-2-macroglobulin domain-containing protein 8 n=1 Tax=Babylonia areolata TaxID=304850 RepID=UPI003FCFDEFD